MEGGSVLGTLLAGGLLLFLGSLIAFAGYRLFIVLLPIYGFFIGLSFGAHSVQALFGDGSVREFKRSRLTDDTLRALITINGGEVITLPD